MSDEATNNTAAEPPRSQALSSEASVSSETVIFPTTIEVPLTLSIEVENQELLEYYTKDQRVLCIADLFDILNDQMFGELLRINGLDAKEIAKKVHLAHSISAG